MQNNSKIHIIPAAPQKREKRVGIYCRVSTSDSEQLKSLAAQVSARTQAENEFRSENIKWGIKQRTASGTSKLYDRKCYGYDHDA